jgi:hypothetical protein
MHSPAKRSISFFIPGVSAAILHQGVSVMSAIASSPRMKRLAAGLSAVIALIGVEAHAFASVIAVTSCADDNTPGTLRHAVANAAGGDNINLSGLSCTDNRISLTQGEIVIAQNVTLSGPSGGALTIASGSSGRVLHSTSADLAVVNLTISGGAVHTTDDDADGGCILAAGNVALVGSTVSNCVASSTNASAHGGAISALSVSLVSSRISGSAANCTGSYQVARGGGVDATSLSCADSTLSGNSVTAESSGGYGQGGGALISDGDVDLSRCTIDSNVAGQGGGIMQFVNRGYSPMTRIQNGTISGNTATYASGGVEVFCPDCTPQPVQILNSTVAFNSAPSGYGVGICTNGSVIAQSSIIANNVAPAGSAYSDLFATDLSGANNLVVSTNVTPAAGVITVTSDPLLLPLADNGGRSWTHRLSASSPARQQGNNAALFNTDQRGAGFNRMVAGTVDIGAYQNQLLTIIRARPRPIKGVVGKK